MKIENNTSLKVYVFVWGSLLLLTIITVLLSLVNLGTWNILVALLIATVKASLVALFFMHLRGESGVTWAYIGLAIFAFFLFVGLSAMDSILRGF